MDTTRYERDMRDQGAWLTQQAIAMGYTGLQDLLVKDFNSFITLGDAWRKNHVIPDSHDGSGVCIRSVSDTGMSH